MEKNLNTKHYVDTLEEVGWYVTFTVLATCIQRGFYTDNITKLYKQCSVPLMPTHVYILQIQLLAIKHLTLFMINKQKLENHQPLVLST